MGPRLGVEVGLGVGLAVTVTLPVTVSEGVGGVEGVGGRVGAEEAEVEGLARGETVAACSEAGGGSVVTPVALAAREALAVWQGEAEAVELPAVGEAVAASAGEAEGAAGDSVGARVVVG